MLTLRRASQLLGNTISFESLSAILREFGFSPQQELDRNTIAALGLTSGVQRAAITSLGGALRGLAIECTSSCTFRESLSDIANSVAKRSPQLLWLVVARDVGSGECAFVCSTPVAHRLRVLSLRFQPERVVDSDAEVLCAMTSAVVESELLTYARWCDILGRESITRRFFRVLEATVESLAGSLPGTVPAIDRHRLALVSISRLLFLSFLETKGWLDGDFAFLSNGYARCLETGGRYQQRVLEPLFFGTLNTRLTERSARARAFGRIPFLNGGLFSRSNLEKRNRGVSIADEAFGSAYSELLLRYRFTPREDSASWSEASVDPEILGKAFEALMAAGERKTSGAFYTPQALVDTVTTQALNSAIGENPEARVLMDVRLLDPACGSGAFLVHALERLAALRASTGEQGSVGEIKRRVLTTSIFGVDSNPMAVWLCELRLWLSITVDSSPSDPMKVIPLPNLDRHIRVGDSLMGGAFADGAHSVSGRQLVAMRTRYMRSTGLRKRSLAKMLDNVERQTAIEALVSERRTLTAARREILLSLRGHDLFGERREPSRELRDHLHTVRSRIREMRRRELALRDGGALPFSFSAHFADVAALGGFNVVLGNPPWVRVHNIARSSRSWLRREFRVYRTAAWEAGAASAGAGRGFAAQVDLASLFVERSLGLLRDEGTLSFLVPAKLFRSLAGGGLRQLLLETTDLLALDDYSQSRSQFDAAVYPSMLVCRKRGLKEFGASHSPQTSSVTISLSTTTTVIRWRSSQQQLPFDKSVGSPWLLLPNAERRSFDCLTAAGVPFADTLFGRPLLGVKTGFNRAYVVRVHGLDGDRARISSGEHAGTIERELLRPLIRGETLAAWGTTGTPEYFIWPYGCDGRALSPLPRLARRWLLKYRDDLVIRSDLHYPQPWWSVFRTEAADASNPRVIWADFGLTPRAMVIESGDRAVPLNSCYVATCQSLIDAHALATLLNGPLTAAWLSAVAEPARGGYHRYLGWTMALLPMPRDWNSIRDDLASLSIRASGGNPPDRAQLLDAALAAYGVRPDDVAPLVEWGSPSD